MSLVSPFSEHDVYLFPVAIGASFLKIEFRAKVSRRHGATSFRDVIDYLYFERR